MAIDVNKIKEAKKVFESRTEEKTKEKKFENQRKDLMEDINQTIFGVFQDSNIKVKCKFEESDSLIIYSYKIQV